MRKTNVFLMGLIDRYTARPEGELFNCMTLAHFAVWYNYTTEPVGDDEHSGNCLPRYMSCKMALGQSCSVVKVLA